MQLVVLCRLVFEEHRYHKRDAALLSDSAWDTSNNLLAGQTVADAFFLVTVPPLQCADSLAERRGFEPPKPLRIQKDKFCPQQAGFLA